MTTKDASYFFDLASRCLSAASDCLDRRAREEFRGIAQDLIRTANEINELEVHLDAAARLGPRASKFRH